MKSLNFGVLDLSCRTKEVSGFAAIQETIELAQLAEQLGFRRYWIAEHHEDNSSHCAPEVLLAALAERTETITLGAGGMLMRYRDPYLVSQAFSLLSDLYPGRIELGIARGRIKGPTSKYFEGFDTSDSRFDEHCTLLPRMWARSRQILRPGVSRPPLWQLGGHAATAGRNRMSLCLDGFYRSLAKEDASAAIREYTESFRAHCVGSEPEYALALAGLCATSGEDAGEWLRRAPETGFPVNVMKPSIVGSPEQWRAAIDEWTSTCPIDTFIVLVASHDTMVKRRSLELIAETFELRSSGAETEFECAHAHAQ